LPTETVYGLAADACNDVAVAKIFVAKGRPADHPLIVHVAHAQAVAHFASDIPAFAQVLMNTFWPGPLTLILPRRSGVATATAGGNPTIGVRCPAHPVALALLKQLLSAEAHTVWGLAAPSANQFGRVSPTTAAHVQSEMGADLLILDGGPCEVGIESTIIDCSRGQPVLLRPGVITPDQVQAACGLRVLLKGDVAELAAPAPKASGTLESHYAPRAKVRLMDAAAIGTALDLLRGTRDSDRAPTLALYSRKRFARVPAFMAQRTMPTHAAAAAHELFAVLRALDDLGVAALWVETPPPDVAWDGVRDRLQRAAS